MEPRISLLCLQDPATGPYREPDEAHPISPRFILTLSSHLRPGFPRGLFSDFPMELFVCIFAISVRSICSTHLIIAHPNYIWGSTQIFKLLFMQFSPASPHFLLLSSKYSPLPVLKPPQSIHPLV